MARKLSEVQRIINSYTNNVNKINKEYEEKEKKASENIADIRKIELRLDRLKEELSNIDEKRMEEINSSIYEEGNKPIHQLSLKSEYEIKISETQSELDQKRTEMKKSQGEVIRELNESKQKRKQEIFDAENKAKKELTMKRSDLQNSIEKNKVNLELNKLDIEKAAIEMRSIKPQYKDGQDINEEERKKRTDKYNSLVQKGKKLLSENEFLKKEITLCDKALQKFKEIADKRVEGINKVLKRNSPEQVKSGKQDIKDSKTKSEKVSAKGQKKEETKSEVVKGEEETKEKNRTETDEVSTGGQQKGETKSEEAKGEEQSKEKNGTETDEVSTGGQQKEETKSEVVKGEEESKEKNGTETDEVSTEGQQDDDNSKKKSSKISLGDIASDKVDNLYKVANGIKIPNGITEDYMDYIWDIKIREKSGTVEIIDDNKNKTTYTIKEALEEKKDKFKRLGISKICKEIAGRNIIKRRNLLRKVNPVLVKALEKDKDLLNNYIKAIHEKDELPFYLTHDLMGLKGKEKFKLNKYVRAEKKSGATILGKLFDRKKLLEENNIKDFKIIQDFPPEGNMEDEYQSVHKQEPSKIMSELLKGKNIDKSIKIMIKQTEEKEGEEAAKRLWKNLIFAGKVKTSNPDEIVKEAKEETASTVEQIKKQEQKQEKAKETKWMDLPRLLNNATYLDSFKKEEIARYANKYGEKEAIKRYRKDLGMAQHKAVIHELKKDKKQQEDEEKLRKNGKQEQTKKGNTDFVEKIDNKDGHIEKNAAESVNKKEEIERVEGEIVKVGKDDKFRRPPKEVIDGEYIQL